MRREYIIIIIFISFFIFFPSVNLAEFFRLISVFLDRKKYFSLKNVFSEDIFQFHILRIGDASFAERKNYNFQNLSQKASPNISVKDKSLFCPNVSYEYIAILTDDDSHSLSVGNNLDEMQDARTPHRGWCRGVWPKKRSSPLLLFRISDRSTEIRWIMHGQSRDVAPCRLFPMHTMHMPSDRWMCQFHRGSVSIRTRVIFIDSKITIRSLSSDARCESERVIFLGAINLPPILIQDTESATVNGRTIERRYPTRTFFVSRIVEPARECYHHLLREPVS